MTLDLPLGAFSGALERALAAGDSSEALKAAVALDFNYPGHLRISLWTLLLLGPPDIAAAQIAEAERLLATPDAELEAFAEWHVIGQDVARTRQDVSYYRSEKTQAWMRRALALVCIDRSGGGNELGSEYMQGLNEILAPFLLLDATKNDDDSMGAEDPQKPYGMVPSPEGPGALHFCLFRAVLTQLAPTLFDAAAQQHLAPAGQPAALSPLRSHLRAFGDLAAYHEAPLVARLQAAQLTPAVYAAPWLVTLLARRSEPMVLFALWDRLLFRPQDDVLPAPPNLSTPSLAFQAAIGDPSLVPYACVALLSLQRAALLSLASDELPQAITQLGLESVAEVKVLVRKAASLRAATPPSFVRLVEGACYGLVENETTCDGVHGRRLQALPLEARAAAIAALGQGATLSAAPSDLVLPPPTLSSDAASSSAEAGGDSANSPANIKELPPAPPLAGHSSSPRVRPRTIATGMSPASAAGNSPPGSRSALDAPWTSLQAPVLLVDCRPHNDSTFSVSSSSSSSGSTNMVRGAVRLPPSELETPQAKHLQYTGRFGGVASLQARLAAVPKHLSPHVVVFGEGPTVASSSSDDVSDSNYDVSSSVDEVAASMAFLLSSRGFPRVSVLRGGYAGLQRTIIAAHAATHESDFSTEKDGAPELTLSLPHGRCQLLSETELPNAEPSSPLLALNRGLGSVENRNARPSSLLASRRAGSETYDAELPPPAILSAADLEAEAGRLWSVSAWQAEDAIAARRLQMALAKLSSPTGQAAGTRRATSAQVIAPLGEASRRAEASLRGNNDNSSSSGSSSGNSSKSDGSSNSISGSVARAESVAACVVNLHATLDALSTKLTARLTPPTAPSSAASVSTANADSAPEAGLELQLPSDAATAAVKATGRREGGGFLDLLARGELGTRLQRDISA